MKIGVWILSFAQAFISSRVHLGKLEQLQSTDIVTWLISDILHKFDTGHPIREAQGHRKVCKSGGAWSKMMGKEIYSKASRYTASSCTDLADARFWIGSKNIWAEQIYVLKPWATRFFDDLAFTLLNKKSCTNFELHEFFLSPKNVHLKALL